MSREFHQSIPIILWNSYVHQSMMIFGFTIVKKLLDFQSGIDKSVDVGLILADWQSLRACVRFVILLE